MILSMIAATALSIAAARAELNATPAFSPGDPAAVSWPLSATDVGDYTVAINTTGAWDITQPLDGYSVVASTIDDVATAQANTTAINYIFQNKAVVYVPDDTFYFDEGDWLLMRENNRLIYGPGKFATAGSGPRTRAQLVTTYFGTITDLVIDGLRFENMNVGLNQVYCTNWTVQNCYFEVTSDFAPYMTSAVLGLNYDLRTVDDLYFHSVHFYNNTFKNCSRTAIECINQHKNLDTRGPAGVIDSTRITDFQIKGNVFLFDEGFYRHPDLSAAMSTPEMCNMIIADNYIDGYYWGLELGTLDDGTNLVLYNYVKAGLVLASDSWTAIRNVTIDYNYLHASEMTYSGSYYFGYVLSIISGGASDGKGGVSMNHNKIIGSVNVKNSASFQFTNNDTTGGSASSATDPDGIYVGDTSPDNMSNGHVISLDGCAGAVLDSNTFLGGKAQPGIRAKNGSTGTVTNNGYDYTLTTLIYNEDTSVVADGGGNALV